MAINSGAAEEVIKIWELGKTPIKVEKLETLVKNYPSKEIADELLNGFTYGFRIGYNGPKP